MFNDFKFLSFDATKQKILKLKEIFDRLSLSSLEKRLIELENVKLDTDLTFEPTTAPIIPEPTDLPDLALVSISSTLYTNYINFEITIQNIGTVASTETTLNEIVTTVFSNSVIVPALEPEETFVTNIQHSFNPAGPLVNHTLLAEVNPTHSLIETTYSNNSGYATVIANQNWPGGPGEPPGGPGEPPGGPGEPGGNPGDPGYPNTYVIVHVHNPEGKELGGLVNIGGTTFSGPTHISQHGVRLSIAPGNKNVSATYNGLTVNMLLIHFCFQVLY